jgi:UTP:GlnB (protein PII) uridylyltransferase
MYSLIIFIFILKVSVKTLEKGFLINVLIEKNRPGMLVKILEAFEDLGLDVLDARVSCEDTFQLEAVGGDVSKTINYISIFLPFLF